jgi:hypothetical protein
VRSRILRELYEALPSLARDMPIRHLPKVSAMLSDQGFCDSAAMSSKAVERPTRLTCGFAQKVEAEIAC